MLNFFKKKENKKALEIIWDMPQSQASVTIKPMRLQRDWMDNTAQKYAYRCLPLNIANQHGWAVYPKDEIVVRCKREDGLAKSDVEVIKSAPNLAVSHFGFGTFTFGMPFTMRVPDGYNLWIGGAPNHFINGASPMTGIYEADWGPFTATMNWKFTRKNFNVVFTPNDPICFIFPIKRQEIEEFTVENHLLSEYQDEVWKKQHYDWLDSRRKFVADLESGKESGWQKHYFQGKFVDGSKCPYSGDMRHRTKLDLDTGDDIV